MKAHNLRDLFVHEIQDLHNAESQIIDALPKLIEKAQDQPLRSALEQHLEVTRNQRSRLEEVARSVDAKLDGVTCKGMAGILKEGEESLKMASNDAEARDAAIVGSAQRVEHYEMAAYGTARTFARMLGESEATRLLEQTLDEEKQADRTLTSIAEDHVNRRAMAVAPGD